MNRHLALALAAAALSFACVPMPVTAAGTTATPAPAAQDAGTAAAEEPKEAPPEFTPAYMNDAANIEAGETLWHDLCRHCHGRSAYPGKAPKLKPRKYTPEFVFDRVTNGFRKMPAWGEAYTREERMSVVAYVLSKSFSP